MGDRPEIGLTIRRTAKGDYEAIIFGVIGSAIREGGKRETFFQEQERFVSKKLPDFMWQLAKRIMPK